MFNASPFFEHPGLTARRGNRDQDDGVRRTADGGSKGAFVIHTELSGCVAVGKWCKWSQGRRIGQ